MSKKSLSPTSNLKILHLYSSIEQSDLSSLNSLNKNEHYKSAFKKNIQSGHDLTKKHSETSLMAKVPSKINNFEGLEKFRHTFSRLSFGRDTTRLTKPRQRTIRKISLLIEYGRARFVTHIVTHHT